MSEFENVDEGIIEDMGEGYRFRPLMQAVLIGILITVTAFILYISDFLDFNAPGELTITTIAFCWILSFLFPLIVKTRSKRVQQITMGLFWAAILSLSGTIILLMVDQTGLGDPLNPTTFALLIAFLIGIGAQLFEHLNPEWVKRSALTYFSIFGGAVIFFICIWIYLEGLIPGFGIWISILISTIFAYALLPEKPK